MQIMRRCDRCAKTYEPETGSMIDCMWKTDDGTTHGLKVFRLCPSCRAKLNRFMENEDNLEGL